MNFNDSFDDDEKRIINDIVETEIIETEDLIGIENDSNSKKELASYLSKVKKIKKKI